MLVLTRNVGETVVVRLSDGRSMTVEVLEVDRGRVRLGLTAPKDVAIFRSELLAPPPAPGPEAGS